MFVELGTLIISTLLSVAGVGIQQLNLEATNTPVMSCLSQSSDTCLESEMCDVFIASSGEETCNVACDMRTVESCAMDSNCAVVDGACEYADNSPVGC